jgi:serine protein kinase
MLRLSKNTPAMTLTRVTDAFFDNRRWQVQTYESVSYFFESDGGGMDIYSSFASRFDKTREEELSLEEYLNLCKNDPAVYAAERMLMAIGEPEKVDTREDPRLSRIFANKVIKVYPPSRFYGMEEVIEQVVSYFRHAAGCGKEADPLPAGPGGRRQVLHCRAPEAADGAGALLFHQGSPVESPLGLFDYDGDGHPGRAVRHPAPLPQPI